MAVAVLIALVSYPCAYYALVRTPPPWPVNSTVVMARSGNQFSFTFTNSSNGMIATWSSSRILDSYPFGQRFFRWVFTPIHELDRRMRRETWEPWRAVEAAAARRDKPGG